MASCSTPCIHGQSRWKRWLRSHESYRKNIVISNRLPAPRKMIFTPVPVPYRGFQIALFTVNGGMEWNGDGEKTSRRRCIYSQRRKRPFKRGISRRVSSGEYRNSGEAIARLHRAMASIAILSFDSAFPGKYPRKRSSTLRCGGTIRICSHRGDDSDHSRVPGRKRRVASITIREGRGDTTV